MHRTHALKKLSLIAASCLSLACMAQTFTWTGAGADDKWSTQDNWSAGGGVADRLPSGGDTVELASTATGAAGNVIDVDVDASFASLTFKGAQCYTLAGSGKITTSGNWDVGAESEDATLTVGVSCALGGNLNVGCGSGLPGVLKVVDGADISAKRVYVGGKQFYDSGRHGWVYQSGGTVTVTDSTSNEAFKLGFAGGGSTGYYELTGGTLVIPVFGSVMSGSTGTFLLDGGTIKANGALAKFCEEYSGCRIHLQIGAAGGTFDTNGFDVNFNSYAIETGVADGTDGGLTKAGKGKLTLGAPWQFTGELKVVEGTVVDSNGKIYDNKEPVTVHERRLITVGGVQRSYALYVPKTVTANPALVISLHGMYGTIYTFYKDVAGVKTKVEQEESEDEGVYCEPGDRSPFRLATADEAGCIVVYPQGLKRALYGGQNYGWLADGENTEDVSFFKAIVEDVAKEHSIDRKRIYCCGFSNGGMMTYAAATLASDTFAAFAAVSGYPLNEFHLRATGARPAPFLHIHGKEDDFVPYSRWLTIRDMMVARNGCNGVPTVTTAEGRYTKSVYGAGEGGFPHVTYAVDGMGHNDWTANTEDGDSSKTIWNFLKGYSLDSACDASLKWRVSPDAESWVAAEHGWTVSEGGRTLFYGSKNMSGDQNVYHAIQLEPNEAGKVYKFLVRTSGTAGNTVSVRLTDVDGGTEIANEVCTVGTDAEFAVATDAYRQCKLTLVKTDAADKVVEVAIRVGLAAAPVREPGNLKYDNAAGTGLVSDGGNWYVDDGSDPRVHDNPTLRDETFFEYERASLETNGTFETKNIFIGRYSDKAATIDVNGGTFVADNSIVVARYGNVGELNIRGGTVTAKELVLGNWGSDRGTVNVYDGELTVTGGNWPGAITLGKQAESRGDLNVHGGTVTVGNSVQVGFSDLTKYGGASAKTASNLRISGGEMSVDGDMNVGNADGGRNGGGHLVVSGGSLSVSGALNITTSSNGWGQVDITGGKLTTGGNIRIGNHTYGQYTVMNIMGGEVDCADIAIAREASAELNIRNAVVKANLINKVQASPGAATSKVFIDGGTIVAKSRQDWFLSSSNEIRLGEGGMAFDTDGYDVTIQAYTAVNGLGGVTKRGEGKLEFVANSFGFPGTWNAHGPIVVEKGTLRLPSNQTIYCTGTSVAEGANLDLHGSTVVIVSREVMTSRWTNAADDGDAKNPLNWNSDLVFYDESGRKVPELSQTLDGVLPTPDTTVRIPMDIGQPTNLDELDVRAVDYVASGEISLIVDDDATYDDYASAKSLVASGNLKIANSLNGLLKSAYAWYDPSDASTLAMSVAGLVTRVANKGFLGSEMDAVAVDNSNAPRLSTGEYDQYKQNGRNLLVFSDNHGFEASPKTDALTATQPRALFAVSARQLIGADPDSQIFAIELSDDTMWSDPPNGRTAIHQLPWGDWADELTAPIVNDAGEFKGFNNFAGFWGNGEGRINVFGLTARETEATAQNRYYNNEDKLETNTKTTTYQSLVATPGCKVRYGRRNQWNSGSKGRLGEAFAFIDELSDDAFNAVNDYLSVKWLGSEPQIAIKETTLESLALEGASVDFDGAPAVIGVLGGYGAIANADGVTVGSAFSFDVDGEGGAPKITFDCALDATAADFECSEALFQLLLGPGAPKALTLVEAPSIDFGEKRHLVSAVKGRKFAVRKIVETVGVERIEKLVLERDGAFSILVR